jgi:hypothetical protein
MAAFRFHISRMHSLPLNPEKKRKEWETIQTIANNNNFPKNLLHKLNLQKHHKTDHIQTEKKEKEFTYHNPKIRKITNLFKNNNNNNDDNNNNALTHKTCSNKSDTRSHET